jgi:DNA modification methylase
MENRERYPVSYIPMQKVTAEGYLNFIKCHKNVVIEDAEITIGHPHEIKAFQPSNFRLETTSTWSFPERGAWATHKSDYRGNWPPQLTRNLILRYSKSKELVLDQMCGGGTTLIECKLLGRNAIGIDINKDAVMLSLDRLNFDYRPLYEGYSPPEIRLYHGDARNLDLIEDESVDLIATHPPYANIIRYSKGKRIEGDLSKVSVKEYLQGMQEIAKESFRVLRPGRFCAILIGDTRTRRHFVPIAFRVMQAFLDAGFILREDIIKQQWKVRKSGERWIGLAKSAGELWVEKPEGKRFWTDFLLIFHEHLFVFRKPNRGEDLGDFDHSMKWW